MFSFFFSSFFLGDAYLQLKTHSAVFSSFFHLQMETHSLFPFLFFISTRKHIPLCSSSVTKIIRKHIPLCFFECFKTPSSQRTNFSSLLGKFLFLKFNRKQTLPLNFFIFFSEMFMLNHKFFLLVFIVLFHFLNLIACKRCH